MTEEQATQDNSKLKLILGGSIASVLAAGVIGFLVTEPLGDFSSVTIQTGRLTIGLSPMM